MAVNPLIVFVGLAVTTLGGLVVVSQQQNPQRQSAPAPVVEQNQPLVLPKQETEAANSATKKVASLPPKQSQNTATEPGSQKKHQVAKPAKKDIGVVPTFDLVRVEEDGGAVMVGKSAPGADISLKLNGKLIGQAKANEKGDWVFVPDQLVPKGNHELIVEAIGKNKEVIRSKQSILIALPKDEKQKPLVVVSKPDAPSRVLQTPEVAAVEKKPKKATEPKPAEVATVPNPSPASPKEKKLASLPKPVKNKSEEKIAAVKKSTDAKLIFGAVDYNDRGGIVFSGKAAAGKTVRLYVDNKFVGDAQVGKTGDWVFRGQESIKPGTHELRADQLDNNGKVAQRTAVPFVRANPDKVAALLKARKKTTQQPATLASPPKVSPDTSSEPVAIGQVPVPKKPVAQEPENKQIVEKPKPVERPGKIARATTDAPDEETVQSPQTATQAPTSGQTAVIRKVPEPKAPIIPSPPAVSVPSPQPSPQAVAEVPEAESQPQSKQAQPASEPTIVASAPTVSQASPSTPEQKPAAKKPDLVSHVVIQPGNNLWNISRVIYGKGLAYTTIYQANIEQIKNPHRIYPGQIFTTPGATSSGSVGPEEREPIAAATGNNFDASN